MIDLVLETSVLILILFGVFFAIVVRSVHINRQYYNRNLENNYDHDSPSS